jgi:hypothetical protein
MGKVPISHTGVQRQALVPATGTEVTPVDHVQAQLDLQADIACAMLLDDSLFAWEDLSDDSLHSEATDGCALNLLVSQVDTRECFFFREPCLLPVTICMAGFCCVKSQRCPAVALVVTERCVHVAVQSSICQAARAIDDSSWFMYQGNATTFHP